MANYQLGYAAGRPQMYDEASRKRKAYRMVKMLEDFLGPKRLKRLTVLDVGSSTGIIDNALAKKFKKVIGIDIDKKAVEFARKKFPRKNLEFKVGDAMNLSFEDDSFDVIVCAQVYEHVPNATRLFSEIHRVLRPGGVCYLAALNRLWPWEPHYNLPFLSWLPKPLADIYIRLLGKASEYYESPRTYWGLRGLTQKFMVYDYTQEILRNPKKFGYEDAIRQPLASLTWLFSPLAKYFSPTFFWILEKKEEKKVK